MLPKLKHDLLQKFLGEQNETIVDFFQALDKDRTMRVPTAAFRKAVKVRLIVFHTAINIVY